MPAAQPTTITSRHPNTLWRLNPGADGYRDRDAYADRLPRHERNEHGRRAGAGGADLHARVHEAEQKSIACTGSFHQCSNS